MNGACNSSFFGLAPRNPGEGSKGQLYHLISIIKSISKISIPNLCSFSQMRDAKHIRWDFNSVALVMPQGWDFGVLVMPRGVKKKIFFFKHGHVAYQIDGDDELNRMQVKFSSYGHTVDLGVRSKGQILLKFG